MWSASPILALVAALLVPSASWVPVEEGDSTWRLLWKNGDALPGRPLESGPGEVRWASPPFADALVIDPDALGSIVFPDRPVEPAEAYRVRTVSGDVFVADLAHADGATLVFSSRRHGWIRAARDMVYTLDLRRHPNLMFDGSQLSNWSRAWEYATRAQGVRLGPSASNWEMDPEGHPHTDKPQAEMHHALDWPERFELALEFASTERPGFALAIGRGVNQALRLETWGDDLVIAQGRQFKRVLVVQEGQVDVRLRLALDAPAGVVEVHDGAGLLLASLSDVQPLEQDAGLTIRSRGRDLTVKLLRAYRQSVARQRQPVDRGSPRVHMIDGEVVYGRLSGDDDGAYVLDSDGVRRDVDLGEIDRIVRPDIELGDVWGPSELTYPDGSVLRGWVEALDRDRVTLRTAFADEPVGCALAGASRLNFGSRSSTDEGDEFADRLLHSAGRLRGRLSFSGQDGSPIGWQVVGGARPAPLVLGGGARIQRGIRPTSTTYDREAYPDVLRLKSREIIACRVVSVDEEQVEFHSPFVEARTLDARHVKAIELSPGSVAGGASSGRSLKVSRGQTVVIEDAMPGARNNQGAAGQRIVVRIMRPDGSSMVLPINGAAGMIQLDGDGTIIRLGEGRRVVRVDGDARIIALNGAEGGVDRGALDRALTVPRFLRDNPPTHVLVARTGDLLRGRLLGIDQETVHFQSKLRSLHIPIGRVARVVDVTKPEDDPTSDADADATGFTETTLRVTLADGSSLIFTPLESNDGELTGRSPIYGAVAIAEDSVDQVRSGSDAVEEFPSVFADWVVRPGKEPAFGGDE